LWQAGKDALYLCTNILWGSETLGGAVTLWIDRAGLGGTSPQAEHLRLILNARRPGWGGDGGRSRLRRAGNH